MLQHRTVKNRGKNGAIFIPDAVITLNLRGGAHSLPGVAFPSWQQKVGYRRVVFRHVNLYQIVFILVFTK